MSYRLVFSLVLSVVLTGSSSAFPIKIDVGNGPLKSGWTEMEGTYGSDGQITTEGITFTASCHSDYEEDWSDYAGGEIGCDYFLCEEECGDPEGRIILTISDLAAGHYQFTSFHNNARGGYRCPLNITVAGTDLADSTTDSNVPITENAIDDNIGTGSVRFITAGSADVDVYFTPSCDTSPEGTSYLNGFILDISTLAVQFDSASSHNLETVSPVVLTVTLSEAQSEPVMVDYGVTGGTAQGGGVDYTLLGTGTLTFNPGETSKTITIEIVDDGLAEQDETIIVTLSNISGECAVLGDIMQHTYTIVTENIPGLDGAYYYRLDSGEAWENVAKVGPHADVTVHFHDPNSQLVFWRGSSHLPCWQTDNGQWYLEEIVARSGDGTGLMQDKINQYSRVNIIEDTLARAIVRWRYVPNFNNVDWDGCPDTGYREFWHILASHSSLLHLDWGDYALDLGTPTSRTRIMLHGMTTEWDVNALIPIARSWQTAPALTINSPGYSSEGYDKTQRAYKISRTSEEPPPLAFVLRGSSSYPIVNPCFVIENWWGDARAATNVNGQDIAPGPDFRQGIEKTAEGNCSLVVWLRYESTGPAMVVMSRAPALPADFDHDSDVDNNDLDIFSSHWLEYIPGGYQPLEADLNNDESVNFTDFAFFAGWWATNP